LTALASTEARRDLATYERTLAYVDGDIDDQAGAEGAVAQAVLDVSLASEVLSRRRRRRRRRRREKWEVEMDIEIHEDVPGE
jgi:hypothetical protein